MNGLRRTDGMSFGRAILRNYGNHRLRCEVKRHKVRNTEAESSDAQSWGGWGCTSEEGPVIGLEQGWSKGPWLVRQQARPTAQQEEASMSVKAYERSKQLVWEKRGRWH